MPSDTTDAKLSVLNAFRHHGERDGARPLRCPRRHVLNAFRHHGERDQPRTRRVLSNHVRVLNATPFKVLAEAPWQAGRLER